MERADDLYWSGLAAGDDVEQQRLLYESAVQRARVLGFVYMTTDKMATDVPTKELIERIEKAKAAGDRDAEAIYGAVDEPRETVSQAMDLYLDKIAAEEVRGHSPKQVRSWRKIKMRACNNFIAINGDPPLMDVTRSQAQAFWQYWSDRLASGEVKPNTANRDVGNMRKLFREYARWMNADVPNPFDKLSFKDRKIDQTDVPPFSVEWIRDRILAPGALASLNPQARRILLIMIETGCRPSELCNLQPGAVHLDAPIPYLSIEYRQDRSLKTASSIRKIPLVGVALAAMKHHPDGFPRYLDREDNFSQVALKHFRRRNLFESDDHVIYSIRHSFEKRMLEAGLTDDFRRLIMGHTIDRPDYGDGGSLEWRQEQLLKIELPFDEAIV